MGQSPRTNRLSFGGNPDQEFLDSDRNPDPDILKGFFDGNFLEGGA